MSMNEGEIDEALCRFESHPVLGPATRFLSEYRHEVNAKSDGWPYWGNKCAGKLMDLIYQANPWVSDRREPTVDEVRRAIRSVKSFCTKLNLDCPEVRI